MTPDLRTDYLGFTLTSPLVASAGPVTGDIDSLRTLEDAGIGAVVLPSLFEEDVADEAVRNLLAYEPPDGFSAESESFLPEIPDVATPTEQHLELVVDAKAALSVPVIASLNGVTTGGWVDYAAQLVRAGADAIECNMYFVAADVGTRSFEVEHRYVDLVRAVRAAVDVPVAVKLSPFLNATASTAKSITDAGADGLVLFNRFYQPDIDLETLEVTPSLTLSTSADLRLPLRWIAILRGRVAASLALSTGVHTHEDVVKAVLAGSDAVMTTSALLRQGPGYAALLVDGLAHWLEEHEYESVAQACGSISRDAVADPDAYERANYVQVIRRAMRQFAAGGQPTAR
jgi:dihydroorotate dehydrogenase (fumarate)